MADALLVACVALACVLTAEAGAAALGCAEGCRRFPSAASFARAVSGRAALAAGGEGRVAWGRGLASCPPSISPAIGPAQDHQSAGEAGAVPMKSAAQAGLRADPVAVALQYDRKRG